MRNSGLRRRRTGSQIGRAMLQLAYRLLEEEERPSEATSRRAPARILMGDFQVASTKYISGELGSRITTIGMHS